MMLAALRGRRLRAAPDRLGTARLRRRATTPRRPAGRYPDQPGAAERLHRRRRRRSRSPPGSSSAGSAAATPTRRRTPTSRRITAVVIGGTSLFGGRGAVIGTLIGALIVQVFDNGLALAGVDPQLPGPRRRRPRHRRRRGRPVDPEGEGMSTRHRSRPHRSPSWRPAAWSRPSAGSSASTASTSTLYPGEVLAVIGDNGAGKSTLIKCLSGAADPRRGRDLPRRAAGALQAARRTPARPASRPSTRPWPSPRRSTSPATCSSPARTAARARSARCSGCSTPRA